MLTTIYQYTKGEYLYALVEARNYDRALIMAYNADNPYPRLYGPK